MKKLLLIVLFLTISAPAWATDFTDTDYMYGWNGSAQFWQTWADHKTQLGLVYPNVTLATGVNTLTLTGQEIGADATVEQLADLTAVNDAIIGYDASGNLEAKSSIDIDVVLDSTASTTSGQITYSSGVISVGNGATSDEFTNDTTRIAKSETLTNKTIDADDNTLQDVPYDYCVAVSDESTALTTGTAKVTFRMPRAMTLTGVRASVTTAPTDAALSVDVNESGTSVFSTVVTIDATEKTSTTATTAAVISDSALADDAEMTIDIDAVGSTIAGAGLKVCLQGKVTY